MIHRKIIFMKSATRLLRCNVSDGQFEDEVAVSGLDHNGEEFSLFVDRKFVEGLPGRGESLIQVTEVAREGDLVLVRLPGKTLANGQTVTVPATSLESEACQEV